MRLPALVKACLNQGGQAKLPQTLRVSALPRDQGIATPEAQAARSGVERSRQGRGGTVTDPTAHAASATTADNAALAATDGQDRALPAPGGRTHAAETRRLYAADWAAFAAWCRGRRHAALPASPATVAAYLGSLSATLKSGALARRAAAIADQHRRTGHASPGADPAVRAVLRAVRHARGQACQTRPDTPDTPPTPPVRRRAAPGPAQLARMAARCPGDLAGLRDRALLLLAAAGLDAERLLTLDREHVRFTAGGAELAGSGDKAGAGTGEGVAVARLASAAKPAANAKRFGERSDLRGACPVRALEDWLRSSDTRFGPVFRKVDRWGNVEHRRLRPDALRRIWRRRAVTRRPCRPAKKMPS